MSIIFIHSDINKNYIIHSEFDKCFKNYCNENLYYLCLVLHEHISFHPMLSPNKFVLTI